MVCMQVRYPGGPGFKSLAASSRYFSVIVVGVEDEIEEGVVGEVKEKEEVEDKAAT